MSIERLPLALAISLSLLGGSFFSASGSLSARPLLQGSTQSYGYYNGDKNVLIAAKESDDLSADGPATNSNSSEKTSSAKDKKATAKSDKAEKAAAKAAEKSAEKSDKESEKEAKKDKDKKAKGTKEAAEDSRAAEDSGAEKKKGGFFHKKGQDENKTTNQPNAVKETVKKSAVVEDENKNKKASAAIPPFNPDDALISVLRDINRSLSDSQNEQVQKIDNANSKLILGMAQEILAKALAEPNLPANRILPKAEEQQAKSSLTAESWSSGDVVVNDKLHGSLAAVWAKRIGGLLSVTIAGDAGNKKTADGQPIGEFMVVVTAHSPVQSGFDIQSQADVTFWMGKLNDITVEASCVPSDTTATTEASNSTSESGNVAIDSKKKSLIPLSPLLTTRYRKHYEILLAADKKSQRAAAELAQATDMSDESAASSASFGDERKTAMTATKDSKGEEKRALKAENEMEAKKIIATNDGAERKAIVGDDKKERPVSSAKETQYQVASASTSGASTMVDAVNTSAATIAEVPSRFHLPSANAILLMPDRALAGQYVTVALLSREKLPESNVELSFNGASLATDDTGQVIFQIPDDTSPGRSLNVALSARPDEVPATVEVLQPLNVTTGQPPRLDRMTPLAIKDSVVTIDGHNFDGIAQHNSVIVDGAQEAQIVSASPFQLKVLMPHSLRPGPHSLCVSTDSMRSNVAGFDYADTVVMVEGKDTGKENSAIKLLIKVLGTREKMNVKILNQTPDVIRLNRGAEITVTSSGGPDNTIQLPAVRGKKGTFHIDTQIEI